MFGNSSVFKRFLAAVLCAALLFSMSACQENPEGSIVVHKDMDNLISRAQDDAPEKTDAAQLSEEVKEQFETYQTTIEDESLGVTVNVNAKVDVPEVDKLSVYRVKQKKFDQDFVDKVRGALMGDKEIYIANALLTQTKEDYEEIIKDYRDLIRQEEEKMAAATEADRTVGSQEDRYVMSVEEFQEQCQHTIDAYQFELDLMQEVYEKAPAELDLKQFPSDGLLHTNQEWLTLYPEFSNENYASLYPDDEDLHFFADSGDGQYQSLRVKNSADQSNELSYSSCPDQYVQTLGFMGELGENTLEDTGFNSTIPEDLLGLVAYDESTVFTPFENDETTITMEEAVDTAKVFLAEIGMEDFAFFKGGLYNECVDPLNRHQKNASNTLYYRHYYILRFYRDMDGVLLTQSSGGKSSEEWKEEGFRTQYWPGEMVELRINDKGIAGFDYFSPVEISETVVDNATLKPFSEIKETFEKMVCVVNASKQRLFWIDIDRVRLSYSRISEKDSFDTGLIVPIWSFEGKVDEAYRGSEDYIHRWKTDTIMAINAIDDSIIDGELGY